MILILSCLSDSEHGRRSKNLAVLITMGRGSFEILAATGVAIYKLYIMVS